jgi:hypothetical protein
MTVEAKMSLAMSTTASRWATSRSMGRSIKALSTLLARNRLASVALRTSNGSRLRSLPFSSSRSKAYRKGWPGQQALAPDMKSEVLWSRVNDATPCCVGYCVGPPNRIELVEKGGDVELGGVDRDAEPASDHFV